MANLLQIYSVKHEQVGELHSIDDAEAVKLVNAGCGLLVFNLCEPSIGDKKLLVSLGLGNPAGIVLHLPYRDAKMIA